MPLPDRPPVSLRRTAAEYLTHRTTLSHDQAVAAVDALLPWLVRRLKRLS